jgi:hypothetical protein
MADKPRRSEEEIAREYYDELLREFNRKRVTSILLAIVFLMLGILSLAYRLPMLAFCCLMIVLIGVIRYWDATGQVEDIRRRPKTFLRAPLSVLEPQPRTPPAGSTGVKS